MSSSRPLSTWIVVLAGAGVILAPLDARAQDDENPVEAVEVLADEQRDIRELLDELIRQINRSLGTTMVVVTHELDSIFTIADRVIMLDADAKGIIAEGDPKQLRDHAPDPRVHAFFNRQAGAAKRTEGRGSGHRSA